MSVTSITIHALNALIGCMSLTILGLVAHSISLKGDLKYTAPPDLKGTGMSFLFWPACGGIVDSCLLLLLWSRTPFRESRTKTKTRYLNALLFVASFHFLRPLIVLIYTSVEHQVEVWACLLSNHGRNDTAEALCGRLQAARYLLIPLFVLGVFILALVAWLRFGVSSERGEQGLDASRAKHGEIGEV